MNILLFDIDGVLVEDRGYRAAVTATVNHFSQLMRQGDCAPDDATIEVFHAHGYTNEWDICPLAIGVLIATALQAQPDLSLTPAAFEDFLAQFSSVKVGAVDYHAWIAATDGHTGRPAERAMAVLAHALDGLPLSGSTRAALAPAFSRLLSDPYDIANSPVTQVFQEHVLGSSLYEEVYRVRSRFDLPSLLYNEDRAALGAAARGRLLGLIAPAGVTMCVYTARPSLPPSDAVNWLTDSAQAPVGFSPEAELALQLIELSEAPLIAMGRMQWLAARVGTKVEYLTKPAPVQALAAIFAAVSGREAASLESAFRMVSEGEAVSALARLASEPVDVWLVEDAVLGIHAATGAVDFLRKHGIDARLRALGVASGGPKADALTGLCEAVLPGVDDAIDYIAERIHAAQPTASSP